MKSFRKTRRMRKRTGGGAFIESTEEMEIEPTTLPPALSNSSEEPISPALEALLGYSRTGFSPSPLDSPNNVNSNIGIPRTGGFKLRRIIKRTGGYKDPNTNLNTNVPALGAPLTREQVGMRQTTQTVAAPAPTRLQNGNTNSTRSVPSNIANAAAGISKKTRRRKRTKRRKRTRRTRSKK